MKIYLECNVIILIIYECYNKRNWLTLSMYRFWEMKERERGNAPVSYLSQRQRPETCFSLLYLIWCKTYRPIKYVSHRL